MPLKKGHSHEVVSHNIREMVRAGHPIKQAVAASLSTARKYKKMASGGLVNDDFDQAGTPQPESTGAEDHYETSKPADTDETLSYRGDSPDNMDRTITEINDDGHYYPDDVANPPKQKRSMAAALEEDSVEHFADGGQATTSPTPTPSQPAAGSSTDELRKSIKSAFGNYHDGGLVTGEEEYSVGAKPLTYEDDGTEADMSTEPSKPSSDFPKTMAPEPPDQLDSRTMAALAAKKKKRRYVSHS